MCRLFGLSASPHRVHATFWLLDAPDSFIGQSRRNPDGTGLGFFDNNGAPVLDKQALAAFRDKAFVREAKHVGSTTFVSHIRFATTGPKTVENCHPFAMDGRLFAHNGMLGGLDVLEAKLGDDLKLVKGQTDSERFCALVTREIRANGGDISAGIGAAVNWLADNVPVCSINFLLATPHEIWAFRYPETDRLFVLERPAGGSFGERELHYVSTHLRVHSPHLLSRPSVILASERLDDNMGWRMIEPGELVHVAPDLTVRSSIIVDHPPAQLVRPDYPTGQPNTQPTQAHVH